MAGNAGADEPLLHSVADAQNRASADSLVSDGGRVSVRSSFAGTAALFLAVFVVLFAIFVRYPERVTATDAQVLQYYTWYIHVAIMIFIGFGFLMTFLRSYSYSAVGFNFVASAFVILSAIFCVGVAQQDLWKGAAKTIRLDLPLLIDANFAAGAAMISFGAVLGKTTPTQLLWLLLLQVPLYAVNARLATYFGALDVGGSITIHAFGAYYGLAASMVLAKPGAGSSHGKNGAIVTSDMTAMIGTLFLWIFWPSFNGALASNPASPFSHDQFHCVVNTVLSLLGACTAAFGASMLARGKFDMVHIQNATLAGGVAVGSSANLYLTPAGALIIGIVTGCISTVGFAYLQSDLEANLGLQDTCGVHNLHGIPGVLGGIAAGLAVLSESNAPYRSHATGRASLGNQLLALLVTLVLAIAGGVVAAMLVKLPTPKSQQLDAEDMYDDEVFWEG